MLKSDISVQLWFKGQRIDTSENQVLKSEAKESPKSVVPQFFQQPYSRKHAIFLNPPQMDTSDSRLSEPDNSGCSFALMSSIYKQSDPGNRFRQAQYLQSSNNNKDLAQ